MNRAPATSPATRAWQVAFALVLAAAAASGCRPRSVDRSSRVLAGDAAGGPPSDLRDSRNGGANNGESSGADSGNGAGGIGGATSDAQPIVIAGSDTAPPRDTAPDLSAAQQTVNALLALTPPTCARKLTGDIPLTTPVGDAAPAETAAICGLNGAVYWVADMDITCDGRNVPATQCAAITHDLDTFAHNAAGAALSASATPYVVVPANLTIPGLRAGTVIAVINQLTRQMTFAVFGDTSSTAIGAASPACADPIGVNPGPSNGGQRGKTVVYIAFTSATSVPADIENQAETAQIGQALTARLITDNR